MQTNGKNPRSSSRHYLSCILTKLVPRALLSVTPIIAEYILHLLPTRQEQRVLFRGLPGSFDAGLWAHMHRGIEWDTYIPHLFGDVHVEVVQRFSPDLVGRLIVCRRHYPVWYTILWVHVSGDWCIATEVEEEEEVVWSLPESECLYLIPTGRRGRELNNRVNLPVDVAGTIYEAGDQLQFWDANPPAQRLPDCVCCGRLKIGIPSDARRTSSSVIKALGALEQRWLLREGMRFFGAWGRPLEGFWQRALPQLRTPRAL